MTKQYRAELRKLKKQRAQMRRELNRTLSQFDKQTGRIERRIFILEGRLS